METGKKCTSPSKDDVPAVTSPGNSLVIATHIAISLQVRHLQHVHGAAFENYTKATLNKNKHLSCTVPTQIYS